MGVAVLWLSSGDIRYARSFSGALPDMADLKLGMLSLVGSLAF